MNFNECYNNLEKLYEDEQPANQVNKQEEVRITDQEKTEVSVFDYYLVDYKDGKGNSVSVDVGPKDNKAVLVTTLTEGDPIEWVEIFFDDGQIEKELEVELSKYHSNEEDVGLYDGVYLDIENVSYDFDPSNWKITYVLQGTKKEKQVSEEEFKNVFSLSEEDFNNIMKRISKTVSEHLAKSIRTDYSIADLENMGYITDADYEDEVDDDYNPED